MDISQLLDAANWPIALVAGLAAVASSAVTILISYARFRRSNRLADNTEAVLRGMFGRGYRTRKFETLRHFIPLEENKLREALLRAGAVRISAADDPEGEQWGLLEHHRNRVFKQKA
ncbi:MAG: hypothetical protein B7Y81_15450 [Caulobacter sp. 32-67-35]|nr:MAG: hypothetical protein B7Y81_15450 [Caulobacter sp. 32-67-35]HQR89953.1 hypothetical protein [Caulobacter sp.]